MIDAAPLVETDAPRRRRVLAVASVGGHWEQMLLLRGAFEGMDVTYVTNDIRLAQREGLSPCYAIDDTNRHHPLRSLRCAWSAMRIIAKVRPDVVISTGAAPGLICIVAGRLVGARGLWVDSMANAERLSGSGRLARRLAHRVFTQWPHLAVEGEVEYHGSAF